MVTPVWGRDGGVAAHVKASATALAAEGLDVHVLVAHAQSTDGDAGVSVHLCPRLLDGAASASERLGELASFTPAVTHFHQLDDPALLATARGTAPVVVSAHGYAMCTSGVYHFAPGEECVRAHGPACVPNLIARGCKHTRYPRTLPRKYLNATRSVRVFERADLAVCYSSAVDRHLAANGIARRAIIPLFPTLATDARAGDGAPGRVVFAGRVEHTKGVDVLITAAAEAGAELVICGGGRGVEPMRALTERLGNAERVRFAGWLAPQELASELLDASLLAIPSLWPEPFGLVGIEALASGRPVVGSDTGGIRDWLEHGVVGLRVSPGDPHALAHAMEELLGDPDRRRAMGAAGMRLVAERFSRERHVATLLDAYTRARSHWLSAQGART